MIVLLLLLKIIVKNYYKNYRQKFHYNTFDHIIKISIKKCSFLLLIPVLQCFIKTQLISRSLAWLIKPFDDI